MPSSAPKIKINNTKKYGADIIFYDPYKEQRESIAEVLADKENRTIIQPYDDHDIIAGKGLQQKKLYPILRVLKLYQIYIFAVLVVVGL